MAYVSETDLDEILGRLTKQYSGKPFVVGYSGYEPFVSTNNKLENAPILPFFEKLAELINADLILRQTIWADFSSEIESHTIATMLEPIIPTRKRNAYAVVPYMQMTTNVLVIPERAFEFVEKRAKRIRELTKSLEARLIREDQYRVEVRPLLHEIAGNSFENRIAVTEGVLEQDILEEYIRRIVILPYTDIEDNIIKSLTKDIGTFVFADHLSATRATEFLYEYMNGFQSRIIPLFREEPPVRALCGFAANITETDWLAKYFTYKCKIDLDEIHNMLLAKIKRGWFEGTHFRLLYHSEILDFPITRYSHMDLLQVQQKIELLERYHEEWIRDLIDQLKAIPNPEDAWISSSENPFTVAQLIEDIRALTPRGIEHIRLWRNVMKTLRKLGRKV